MAEQQSYHIEGTTYFFYGYTITRTFRGSTFVPNKKDDPLIFWDEAEETACAFIWHENGVEIWSREDCSIRMEPGQKVLAILHEKEDNETPQTT